MQALSAAAGLLGEGGRFVFDVFEPSAADIRATHDRWIARREGISERPLWDAAERRLELDVRLPGRVVPMTLEWRSGAEWSALCAEAGLTVVSAESGFGGEPLDGRQGDQVYVCERLQLVERQRACDRDVERLGALGQRDARDRVCAAVTSGGRPVRSPPSAKATGAAGASSASVRSPRASSAITGSGGASASVITGTE